MILTKSEYMKVSSIQQQNFRGSFTDKLADKISNNPDTVRKVVGLAGCSVVAQKLVMSAGEVSVAPFIDIGVGKAITKITGEKDGRTNQSSKVQATRTVAQTVGGTITGIIIRVACIAAATAICAKLGQKVGDSLGGKIGRILADSDKGRIKPEDLYNYQEKMSAWGKNIGGAAATLIMMVTNFLIDAPLINWINKKISPWFGIKTENQKNEKEVK